jgi:protein-S-isoprenylcysteine O-methyltransferase Ste14
MTPPPDSPGVRLPPPLLYALAILIGVLLERRWPLPIPRNPASTTAGIVFLIGWLALMLASVGLFRRAHTSLVPIRPAHVLVIAGPYHYTRNPMYVSLSLLTIGCAFLFGTSWPILLLIPTLIMVQRFVILPEERYLRRRFGADYENYLARVRRWV